MSTMRRHSKKRDAILSCIRRSHLHPSAEWIYTQLKPEHPDLSLGTVYRNLAVKAERSSVWRQFTVWSGWTLSRNRMRILSANNVTQ